MNDVADLFFKFAPIVGPGGIVFLLWYWSDRSATRMLGAYREDTMQWRREHEMALAEVRQMYVANVELVKDYKSIANSLQDVVVLNTQTITSLCKAIDDNQFCPMVRLKKQAPGSIV